MEKYLSTWCQSTVSVEAITRKARWTLILRTSVFWRKQHIKESAGKVGRPKGFLVAKQSDTSSSIDKTVSIPDGKWLDSAKKFGAENFFSK